MVTPFFLVLSSLFVVLAMSVMIVVAVGIMSMSSSSHGLSEFAANPVHGEHARTNAKPRPDVSPTSRANVLTHLPRMARVVQPPGSKRFRGHLPDDTQTQTSVRAGEKSQKEPHTKIIIRCQEHQIDGSG